MTDRDIMQQALEALQAVKDAPSKDEIQRAWIVCNLLQRRLAQPQRTHWEGCDEVHPECKKQQEPVAWKEGYAAGAAAEREACAKVCDALHYEVDAYGAQCAAAIRARGQE